MFPRGDDPPGSPRARGDCPSPRPPLARTPLAPPAPLADVAELLAAAVAGIGGAERPGQVQMAEAVRQAIRKLGQDATPTKIREWILKTHKIEMGTDHISTQKGEIRRKAALEKAANEARKAPAKAPVSIKAPPPEMKAKAAPAKGSGVVLNDVLALRELVDRVGPTLVKTLVDEMTR